MSKVLKFIKERRGFITFSMLKVLSMVLGLVTNIFIVRKLSVNDFGVFSIALMLIGLLKTFGFSWSSSSILYYGGKEKAQTGKINKTFWARNIIIAVSLAIVTILFVIFRTQINNYIGLNVAFLLLIWLYVGVAEDYLIQYFLAVNKQLLSSVLAVTAKAIYILFLIIFNFDVTTLIILNIVSHASVLLYVFSINKKDVGKFEFDKDWFKEILNFSLWQLFGFSGVYLINFGDTAVIKYFMTNEDVAVYNVAAGLFNAIVNFSFVISSYYAGTVTQFFSNKEGSKLKKFFYKERFFVFGLSTFAHIIVMIFSKPIIEMLYGSAYSSSVVIFNILMIGSIIRYWSVFYMLYYNTNKKYELQQSLNIFRAVINIVLNIVFIKIFGLIGPAIATTISILITTIFSIFYCEKRIIKATEII